MSKTDNWRKAAAYHREPNLGLGDLEEWGGGGGRLKGEGIYIYVCVCWSCMDVRVGL